jgi:hypothetical protein
MKAAEISIGKQRITLLITVMMIFILTGLFCPAALDGEPKPKFQKFHNTSPAVEYKCLFNHESAIFCTFTKDKSPKDSGPEYLASFIEKLEGTDVDAVMFCPTAWRANIFPSEIDPWWKDYRNGQVTEKWRGYDYIMKYIHDGGDPVAETLAACRETGIDFLISYRMNDAHYIVDKDWPTHTDFWRDNPQYWLGDSNISATFKTGEDNVRLHNYMLEPVRDWYFSILEELCTNYDVDGLELDFQRAPRFFYNKETEAGKKVMTGFVKRIRQMLDRIGTERGKSLKLCVRVPETIAKCDKAGLDVIEWDRQKLVDMINLSPYYLLSLNVDIEDFKARTNHAKIYAEMLRHNQAIIAPSYKDGLRYTNAATFRGTALNFLARGADGISLFNYDYIPHGSPSLQDTRAEAAKDLKGITDIDYLKNAEKVYLISPLRDPSLMIERNKTAKDEASVEVVIPDDTSKVQLTRAVLRVETKESSQHINISARLNGKPLGQCDFEGTEFFEPIVATTHGYPKPENIKFYAVPFSEIIPGKNTVEIENLDREKYSCEIISMELALLR